MKERFQIHYDTLAPYRTREPPLVHIPLDAVAAFEDIASLRTKRWASSKRVNPKADAVGLLAELAVFRWLGMTGAEALENFLAGLRGDNGVDITL